MKNIAIITQFWHGAKCYLYSGMCVETGLITVTNMNKINPLCSEISQQMHKMYETVVIITQIWYREKYYFTSKSNMWYLITVPNMNKITTFFSDLSQQTLKIYEKIAIL